MADVNAGLAQDALIIRGAPGKHVGLAFGSLAFVVVGVLMLTVPPPAGRSAVLAGVSGVLSILLRLAGLGAVHARIRTGMRRAGEAEQAQRAERRRFDAGPEPGVGG